MLGDTQPNVITPRKYPLGGFSRFFRLLAELFDRDDVRCHHVEATSEHQDEGDDADEPYKIKTVEKD